MSLQSTKWIGKHRLHFEEIDSTNKQAKELAQAGSEHGTLITADTQTAGSGRRGRNWSSEKGAGIYMSVLLRPDFEPNQAPMLTLVAALAVAKAITHYFERRTSSEATGVHEQVTNANCESSLCIQNPSVYLGKESQVLLQKKKRYLCKKLLTSSSRKRIEKVSCRIKWPNDIVINGKKICGILTEMILNKNQIDAVILGIGINVSNTCFSDEISSTASSLYLETGLGWDKEQLIEEIWNWFEFYYDLFLETKDLCRLKAEYEAFLVNKNEKVKVLDPHGEYTGMAKGITNTGELLVDTGTTIKIVASGEVSVRGIYGYV